jgi:hypothetical protein
MFLFSGLGFSEMESMIAKMNNSYTERSIINPMANLVRAPGRRIIRDMCIAYYNANAREYKRHFEEISAVTISVDQTFKFA